MGSAVNIPLLFRSISPYYLLFTFIIFYAAFVTGNPIIHCTSDQSSDICLNNGTCLLTSKSAAYQLCRETEYYFNENCYKIIEELKTWYEANELCKEYGGELITIENELQRLFIADLLSSFYVSKSVQGAVAAWTAGRELTNGTEAVYVWAPNNYVLESDFWEEGQPQADSLENCIEINSRTQFRNWATSSCSNENYFVCSRPTVEEKYELENVQCMCRDGYRGTFCDISLNEPGIVFQSQSVACIGDAFKFSCPKGGTINVDFALYGNVGNSYELCLNSPQSEANVTSWEVCVHPSSLQTLTSICQGLTYCQIENLQSLFPDSPCLPTTPITLQYRMRCLNEPMVKCRLNAIYQSGRCYIPYITDEPLPLTDAQTRCRKEGGQLAFSVGQTAQNEIVASIRNHARSNVESCYWMGELGRPKGASLCDCYYITNETAFWSQRSCGSKQQWVCEFAPETTSIRPTEVYHQPVQHHIIFDGQLGSSTESSTTVGDSDVQEALLSAKHSFCEKYEWNKITIPRTLSCSYAQVPCGDPEQIIGVVKQKCTCGTSEWEGEPSTANCTHKWVRLLDKLIDDDAPAEEISWQWAQMLKNSSEQTLSGGDIVSSIEIGEKLLSLAEIQFAVLDNRTEQSEKATAFAQTYGEAGNKLLSDQVEVVWMSLPDDVRISKASALMSSLEQSAALMASFIIEEQKKIDYSNWALEVQVKKPAATKSPEPGPTMMSDDDPIVAIPRSRGFAAIPFTPSSSNVAAASTAAVSDESVGNVSFSTFSLSPILSMPSLRILQQSSQPVVSQSTKFDDFGAVPRSRAGFISLDRNPLRLGYYVFRSVGVLLSNNKTTLINSLVIGASVNNPLKSVSLPKSDPVTFKFYHIRTAGVSNPRCVFWDTANTTWSEEGCTMLYTSNNSTGCSCTHLTSFAILMDIDGSYDYNEKSTANHVLNLITIVGCAFSIACLFLAVLIFTCFRSLWNIRHTIHRNLCFCLLLAELIFVIGIDRTENKLICRSVAVALHYLFLAAFCWMLLEGYQLYLMLIQVFETDEVKAVLYYLYAYGFPAVIVAVTAGVAWPNYSTDQYCWLNVETPTVWAFAGPIAVVIVSNIVFLGVALRVVLSVRSCDRSRAEQMLGWLKGSGTLLCLLGVTWIFGYLMVIQGAQIIFAYIFTILNCLQGVFIFVIHIILNDKVRLTLLRFMRATLCCMPDSGPGKTPSVISSRQKLMNIMKNGGLSRGSSQPSTGSTGLIGAKINSNKGLFVGKKTSLQSGARSPATMITYLDWKTKMGNESRSIPSDDSGNYDCEPKEARSVSDEIEMNMDQFRKESDADDTGRRSVPIRRKTSGNNGNEPKLESSGNSDRSTIVERF